MDKAMWKGQTPDEIQKVYGFQRQGWGFLFFSLSLFLWDPFDNVGLLLAKTSVTVKGIKFRFTTVAGKILYSTVCVLIAAAPSDVLA